MKPAEFPLADLDSRIMVMPQSLAVPSKADSTQRLVIRHLLWPLHAETLPFTVEPMRGIGVTSLLKVVTNFISQCMGRTLFLRTITWWAHCAMAIRLMFTSQVMALGMVLILKLARFTPRTTALHSPSSMNVEGREGNPERKRRAPCSVLNLNHKPSYQEDEGEDEEAYPGCVLKWGGGRGRFLLAAKYFLIYAWGTFV